MKLRNMKIGFRLGAGFTIIIGLLIIIGIMGITSMRSMSSRMDKIVNEGNIKVKLANEASGHIADIVEGVFIMSAIHDREIQEKANEKVRLSRDAYKEAMDKLAKLDTTEKGQVLINKVVSALAEGKDANIKITQLAAAGKMKEALLLNATTARGYTDKAQATLIEMIKYQEDHVKILYDEAWATYTWARTMLIAIGLFAIFFSLGVALFMTRTIRKPLGDLVAMTDKLALGDVNVEVQDNSKDEIGQLSQSFNTMVHNIKESALAAEKVANGNLDVEINVRDGQDLSDTLQGFLSGLAASSFIPPLSPPAAWSGTLRRASCRQDPDGAAVSYSVQSTSSVPA